MHKATIMRRKYIKTPIWIPELKINTSVSNDNILQFYKFDIDFSYVDYENVIIDNCKYDSEIEYWKGIIKQSVLNVGDTLILENESPTINIVKVEKNIDGSVIYHGNDLYVKCDNYDELLEEVKIQFDNYSDYAKYKAEIDELIINEQDKKSKSWWKKIFN